VESSRDAKHHTAEYGNLLLAVSSSIMEQESVFEFVVKDKADRFHLLDRNRLRCCHGPELRDFRSTDIP